MGSSLEIDPIVALIGGVLVVGAILGGLASRTRIPALLLFLALGMVLADEGLAIVRFDDAELAQSIAMVALVVILFDGGLGMRTSALRGVVAPASALATAGVAITAAVVAGVARLVLPDLDTSATLLIGAIVASTDAAAVLSVLRGARLPTRLIQTLEAESGLNDPAAALLTVGIIATWEGTAGATDWAWFIVVQFAGGAAIGLGIGAAAAALLRRAEAPSAALGGLFALGAAAVTYAAAAAIGASGLLAVYLCGVVIGSSVPRRQRSLLSLLGGLAAGAQLAVFTVLGLLVFPSELLDVAAPALLITAALVLVARPLAVLVCLAPFRFPASHLAFASWAGLRGAVPIVLATFPFLADHPDSQGIFDVVFFVVVVSVGVQSVSLPWVGSRLGLRADDADVSGFVEALPLAGGGAVVELELADGSPVLDRSLMDLSIPLGARVAAVIRDGETVVPHGRTTLEGGDLVVLVLPRDVDGARDVLGRWARAGEAATRRPRDGDSER